MVFFLVFLASICACSGAVEKEDEFLDHVKDPDLPLFTPQTRIFFHCEAMMNIVRCHRIFCSQSLGDLATLPRRAA
jgi:hypothetical protein